MGLYLGGGLIFGMLIGLHIWGLIYGGAYQQDFMVLHVGLQFPRERNSITQLFLDKGAPDQRNSIAPLFPTF